MKPLKIKKVKHYSGEIYLSSQELRDITMQMGFSLFEGYMDLLGFRYVSYRSGGGDLTTIEIAKLELVDSLCRKHSQVKGFSSVCLVKVMECHYAVEATNDQLIKSFLRLAELKAFL
jgi:hypothetical protein